MPAAICFKLPAGARWQLEQLRRGVRDARMVIRAQVILLSADGKPVREITQATGLKRVAIWKWRKRYSEEGVEGLYDRPRPGPEPSVTPQYLNLLRKTVMRSPRKLGFAFNVWTGARLAEYLAQKTGIRVCSDWVLELLKHKLDFSYQRPKHTLKGKRDEKAHAHAQTRLATLKKGLSRQGPPMNSGTRTKRNSTSIPTWLPYGPREVGNREWRVLVRTRSGLSTEPLTSRRAKSFMKSGAPRLFRVSMTW